MPQDKLVPERKCLDFLFRVLDGWKALQAGRLRDVTVWQQCIVEHHKLFSAIWGESEVKPKHHMALHIVPLLTKHGVLQATMVHERRHKIFKEFAAPTKHLKTFNMSVGKKLLNKQVESMGSESLFRSGVFCVGEVSVPRDVAALLSGGDWSACALVSVNGVKYGAGDVILAQTGHEEFMLRALRILRRGADAFILGRRHHEADGVWVSGELALVPATSCNGACIWSQDSNSRLCCLLPGHRCWESGR